MIEFPLTVQKKSNLTIEFEYEMDKTIHFRKDCQEANGIKRIKRYF
jgi:hypothetical protein